MSELEDIVLTIVKIFRLDMGILPRLCRKGVNINLKDFGKLKIFTTNYKL